MRSDRASPVRALILFQNGIEFTIPFVDMGTPALQLRYRLLNERNQRLWQRDIAGKCKLLRLGRHFVPGLADDIQPFFFIIFRVLVDKRLHVVLNKHQIGDIFQHLRIRVFLDLLLCNGLSNPANNLFTITRLLQRPAAVSAWIL